MADNPAKKMKLDGPLIGTHNGHFHADEALAVYLLRLLPAYANSPLVRTRDPAILSTCHTVVDVGGEYNTETNRYDHHQREFDATFDGRSTTLSSAGLVYKHFGKAIISTHTAFPEDSPDVVALYKKIYLDFIEAFDANDNGISAYDPDATKAAGLSKRFDDKNYTLASVVSRYNYLSKAPTDPPPTKEMLQAIEDANFARASAFMGEQFILHLGGAHESHLARTTVAQAYHSRTAAHPSGKILIIPQTSIPWKTHVYSLEAENPEQEKVLFVLYPESADADSKWRIQAVSVEEGSFVNRKDLPNAWKGVRDEELSQLSGIPGCVFVHRAGFIGGHATREGALAMATKAIEV